MDLMDCLPALSDQLAPRPFGKHLPLPYPGLLLPIAGLAIDSCIGLWELLLLYLTIHPGLLVRTHRFR